MEVVFDTIWHPICRAIDIHRVRRAVSLHRAICLLFDEVKWVVTALRYRRSVMPIVVDICVYV